MEDVQYDKEIISERRNKDGKEPVYRIPDCYNNGGEYDVFLEDGQLVGYVGLSVCNFIEGNTAELEYCVDANHRNRGNIGIAVEEVLKDVFIDKSYDGLQIRPSCKKSNISRVVLMITSDNVESKAVAAKNHFSIDEKRENVYVMTKERFLELLKSNAEKSGVKKEESERADCVEDK